MNCSTNPPVRLQPEGYFHPEAPADEEQQELVATPGPEGLQFPRADNGGLPVHFARPEAAFT